MLGVLSDAGFYMEYGYWWDLIEQLFFPVGMLVGGIAVWLEGGSCKAVSFTADSVYPDAQTLEMMGKGGWTADTCEWDGTTAGVSKDGNIVGTSPMLDIKG